MLETRFFDRVWVIDSMILAGGSRRCNHVLRHLVLNLGWTASRKYCFSLFFIAVVWAKLLHIYSHHNSLALGQFLLWGPTFFLQDALCILVFRALTRNFHHRQVRAVAALVAIPAR